MAENIIVAVHDDILTGLSVLQDFAGRFYILPEVTTVPPLVGDRVYIQTLSHEEFTGISDFYPIPNELTGQPDTKYTTPSGKSFNILSIAASQDRLKGGKIRDLEMSLLGIYVNGSRVLSIPFRYDMHFVLAETLRFPVAAEIELKVRPCDVKTRVAVLVSGFLTE